MTTRAKSKAPALDVQDVWEWVELAYERNWTDGLPPLPPTPEKVAEMVDYAGGEPDRAIGVVPPGDGLLTVEGVAINAVMAGCRPEYMPVIIAAMQAMLEPSFNLHGVQCTVHPCTPLTIVCGPIVRELGFNTEEWAFGGGARPNATIGRALRHILCNVGGALPGRPSKTTFAHPGRFSYCVAEDLDDSPWGSLATDFGLSEGQDAVVVFACESPHMVQGRMAPAKPVLDNLSYAMAYPGSNNAKWLGQCLVVLAPPAARTFGREGWTKKEVQSYLHEHARIPIRAWRDLDVRPEGMLPLYWGKFVDFDDLEATTPLAWNASDFLILTTGGDGGTFNAFCPGWGDHGGFAVAKPIERPR